MTLHHTPTTSLPPTRDLRIRIRGESPAGRSQTGSNSYDDIEPLLHKLADLAPADPDRAQIRENIVTMAMPLGEHIARRYAGRGVEYEDLMQIAALGVVLAADRFDPARGTTFLAFAVPTIMGEVKRYFRDSTWALRIARRVREVQQGLHTAIPHLAQQFGREPTARELAQYLGVDLSEITQALIAMNGYHTGSLDAGVPARGRHDGTPSRHADRCRGLDHRGAVAGQPVRARAHCLVLICAGRTT